MSVTVSTSQAVAREVLRAIGVTVPFGRAIVLTDRDDTGVRGYTHRINPGQLEYAVEQHRLVTGESIDYADLEACMPWIGDDEGAQ